MKILNTCLVLCGLSCGLLFAQSPQTANATQESYQNQPNSSIPVYRVTVIARTMKAINYQHQNGATKINLLGTDLQPAARAEAKVESKKGYIEIEVEFDDMQPATKYGNEYLTYVLWAITPEGRTSNLGEILLDGGTKSKLNVTTELQVFGLAVTAEPYFAVSIPSNLVVMENALREDTVGRIEEMDAVYELLQRGGLATISLTLTDLYIGQDQFPLQSETLTLQAEKTTGKDAAKIGIGTGVGAIIGAIAGGRNGILD